MADRQEAQGKEFGKIIPFDDGVRMLLKVVEVRKTSGDYEGHLLDCISPNGTAFSINGHKILVDKVMEFFLDAPMWFEIERIGKVGRAIFYHVYQVVGSDNDILTDKSEHDLLESSQKLVDDGIRSLPSTDVETPDFMK